MNNSHILCGDYLFSGHTVMLTLSYLFIKECESFLLYFSAFMYTLCVLLAVCVCTPMYVCMHFQVFTDWDKLKHM